MTAWLNLRKVVARNQVLLPAHNVVIKKRNRNRRRLMRSWCLPCRQRRNHTWDRLKLWDNLVNWLRFYQKFLRYLDVLINFVIRMRNVIFKLIHVRFLFIDHRLSLLIVWRYNIRANIFSWGFHQDLKLLFLYLLGILNFAKVVG